MKPRETISFTVSVPGRGTFLILCAWSINPLNQYCWFCRGSTGSQLPSMIFVMSEGRMVRTEYLKPR
jgi:hypothetical protein